MLNREFLSEDPQMYRNFLRISNAHAQELFWKSKLIMKILSKLQGHLQLDPRH